MRSELPGWAQYPSIASGITFCRRFKLGFILLPLLACAEADQVVGTELESGRDAASRGVLAEVGEEAMVTVYFRSSAGESPQKRDQLIQAGARYLSRNHGQLPAALSIARKDLDRIRALDWVRIVEVDSSPPSFPMHSRAVTGGLPFMTQTVPWGVISIGANTVQTQFGISGAGLKVAVLDQGVQLSHPDLGSFVGCFDAFNQNTTCFLQGSHGTAVGGVIAAVNNGLGSLGVAPGISGTSVRVCDPGGCPDAAVYDALLWVKDQGFDVVNMSIGNCGGSVGPTMYAALNYVIASGAIIVAAGGNGSSNPPCTASDPVSKFAAAPQTIAVAAYGSNLLYKSGFQYGPEIDFSAPTDVYTTTVYSDYDPSFGGTSAAAPHVTGAIALMLSAGFQKQHIYQRLKETAFNPESSGHNNHYGWGEIRVSDAIVAKPNATSISWCTGGSITGPMTCNISATVQGGIAPIQVRFEISRSDQPGVVDLGWGSATRTIQVAAGDYTLSIKATAREGYYLRTGYHTIQDIPVCPSGQSALILAGPGGPETQAVANCGGGGNEN